MAEISGKGVPTSKTAGALGDYYTDTNTNLRYKCTLAYMTKDDVGKDVLYYKWNKVNSSSSSGGTTNYSDLSNKPKINGIDLVGNKSTVDLKLVGPTVAIFQLLTEALTMKKVLHIAIS